MTASDRHRSRGRIRQLLLQERLRQLGRAFACARALDTLERAIRFVPAARIARCNPGDGLVGLFDYVHRPIRGRSSSSFLVAVSPAIVLVIVVLIVVAVVVPVAVVVVARSTADDGAEYAKRNAGGNFTVVNLAALVEPDAPLTAVAEALAPAAFVADDTPRFVAKLATVVECFNAGLPPVAEAHATPAAIADHDGYVLDVRALRKGERQRIRVWRRQA